MVNQDTYIKLRELYGKCSSWAIWNDEENPNYRFDLNGKKYYLNSVVKKFNKDLTSEELKVLGLHNKLVLIALNFGQRDEKKLPKFEGINSLLKDIDFSCFHEELDDSSYSGDSRQKYAYKNTPLWGAYMTDIIKFNKDAKLEPVADSKSESDNLKELMRDDEYISIQINGLINELNILGVDSPTLVAIGGSAYSIINKRKNKKALIKALGKNTKIISIPHYSRANTIKDDVYIKKIKEIVKDVKIN